MVAPFRVDRMGESAVLVTLGDTISRETNARVHSLDHVLRDASLLGLEESVPGYASLLVQFDPTKTNIGRLETLLQERSPTLEARRVAAEDAITVPVRYGGEWGPDLDDVARLHNVSAEAAVALHTRNPYVVYFVGFMPGFAYMGTVTEEIATPRLETPRPRVPAGSVGIAGRQTGIYPFASPGGWRLLGRTGIPLWDPDRPNPALLAPGSVVHFRSTLEEPAPLLGPPPLASPAFPVFDVDQPGLLTTIQDLGRSGYANVGLSRGGAMDRACHVAANALVGNDPSAATLEITWSGPVLRALATTTIALAGADLGCQVEGRHVPIGVSWLVRAGSSVRFESPVPAPGKARAYLAVAGGFDAPVVLGSRSTCLPGGFGGLGGRALRTGDVLGTARPVPAPGSLAGRVKHDLTARAGEVATLRYTRFTGPGSPGEDILTRFCGQEYEVGQQSDRTGTRLAGEAMPADQRAGELLSFGVVQGAIQLPPDGNPVVLNVDHQTTGGYPVPGVVIAADWPLLAQLVPGSMVRFCEVSLDEALGTLPARSEVPK